MAAPTLSFGVELEGVLVFHESLLTPHIPPDLHLKKRYTDEEIRLKGEWPVWLQGWALQNAAGNLFRYDGQPLDLAIELLQPAEDLPPIVIKGRNGANQPGQWRIEHDASVYPLDREQKAELLRDPKFLPLDEWDSSSIEFVSPVYVADVQITDMQDHVDELRRHLETRHSTIVITDTCGFHVHVGQPDNSKFPLDVLRALAFLVVMYEDEMSLLHDELRVPDNTPINSNRSRLESYGSALKDRIVVDGEELCSTYLSVAEIRRRIFFADHDSEEAAYAYLKDLLSDTKQYVINWANIDGNPVEYGVAMGARPPTIEFRQHAGTFDGEDVGHWVRFCVALVRLAYDLAKQGSTCLPAILTWRDRIDLEDVLVRMDLPPSTLQFYRDRLAAARQEGRELPWPLWRELTVDELEEEGGEEVSAE